MASRKANNDTQEEDTRLLRIRENQRRSRARRREYLEDLESRWKKCQEIGVQADLELQKAARRVIEENGLLRKILAELGLETPEVEKRLRVLRETTVIDGGDNASIGSNDCLARSVAGSNLCCVGQGMVDLELEQSQSSQIPGSTEGERQILSQNPIEIASTDISQANISIPGFEVDVNTPPPPVDQASLFSMNLLETIPDFDNIFGISEFLEPLDLPAPSSETTCSFTESQHEPSSTCAGIPIPNPPIPPPTSATVLPHKNDTACKCTLKNTTPCTEAYELLKGLNSQRQEHKDMFEIVIELWNGFCFPNPGEDTEGKGCRVDNEMLQKVIDGMK